MEPAAMSKVALLLGMFSLFLSFVVWMRAKAPANPDKARMERMAVFVGLWAPSLFALATYFSLMPRS